MGRRLRPQRRPRGPGLRTRGSERTRKTRKQPARAEAGCVAARLLGGSATRLARCSAPGGPAARLLGCSAARLLGYPDARRPACLAARRPAARRLGGSATRGLGGSGDPPPQRSPGRAASSDGSVPTAQRFRAPDVRQRPQPPKQPARAEPDCLATRRPAARLPGCSAPAGRLPGCPPARARAARAAACRPAAASQSQSQTQTQTQTQTQSGSEATSRGRGTSSACARCVGA
jgi:hypothetical protein